MYHAFIMYLTFIRLLDTEKSKIYKIPCLHVEKTENKSASACSLCQVGLQRQTRTGNENVITGQVASINYVNRKHKSLF